RGDKSLETRSDWPMMTMNTASIRTESAAAGPVLRAAPSVTYLNYSFRQFEAALERRLRAYFSLPSADGAAEAGVDVVLVPDDSPFGRFVREHARDDESRLLALLALASSMKPDFFDRIMQRILPGAG